MVYVHLAEGVEEIEAVTIVDVLRRGGIEVKTVSISSDKLVTGAHDIVIAADMVYEEADYSSCDMIVLPGGMPGTKHLEEHQGLAEKIKQFVQENRYVAAICAAPMILGRLSLLEGKRATIYTDMEEHLKGAIFVEDPVVVDGRLITSRGPGTAAEFSLKLVELLKGAQEAENLRKAMIL